MTLDTYRNLLIELSLAQLELQLATLRSQPDATVEERRHYRLMVADLRRRVTVAGPVEDTPFEPPDERELDPWEEAARIQEADAACFAKERA